MSSLRGEVCVILQRVKYVELGGSLDPIAGDILALVSDALLKNADGFYASPDTLADPNEDGWISLRNAMKLCLYEVGMVDFSEDEIRVLQMDEDD